MVVWGLMRMALEQREGWVASKRLESQVKPKPGSRRWQQEPDAPKLTQKQELAQRSRDEELVRAYHAKTSERQLAQEQRDAQPDAQTEWREAKQRAQQQRTVERRARRLKEVHALNLVKELCVNISPTTFSSMDLNGDGFLSLEELKVRRKHVDCMAVCVVERTH